MYGASLYTKSTSQARLTATTPEVRTDPNWGAVLEDIQAQDPSYTLPEAPTESSIAAFLDAAESPNLTDTVGRTLLVNLSAAKSQGLGDDLPTQDQILAQATAQLPTKSSAKKYFENNLNIVEPSKDTLRSYGNAVVTALIEHPDIEPQRTYITIGMTTDTGDTSYLQSLAGIRREYDALVADLLSIPVPRTFVPLHLQMVNALAYAATTYADMALLPSDPLRALAALQLFQSQSDEVGRVFTTLAQAFSNNAIIFTKDEPGHAWNGLLSASGTQ